MTTLRCIIIQSRHEQPHNENVSTDDVNFPDITSRRIHDNNEDIETHNHHKIPDYICSICEKEINDRRDDLKICHGDCCRVFHANCYKGNGDIYNDNWVCEDCKNRRNICFSCNKEGFTNNGELIKCSKEYCGKFYCPSCIKKMDETLYQKNPFVCCLHLCMSCKKEASKPRPIVRCIKCPTAYHRTHLPDGWHEIMKMRYICPKHIVTNPIPQQEEIKPEPKKRGRKPKAQKIEEENQQKMAKIEADKKATQTTYNNKYFIQQKQENSIEVKKEIIESKTDTVEEKKENVKSIPQLPQVNNQKPLDPLQSSQLLKRTYSKRKETSDSDADEDTSDSDAEEDENRIIYLL